MKIEAKVWHDLKSGVKNKSGIAVRRVELGSGLDFFAAMTSPDGLPAILLETRSEDVPNKIDKSCQGFSLKLLGRGSKASGQPTRILLQLSDISYQDVFYILADDLASKMDGAGSESSALLVFLDLLSKWMRFFEKFGGEGLKRQQLQGLYGELWTMRNVLFDVLGVEKTIQAWVGPDGDNQDFSIDNFICETKTSVLPPHEKFGVSNILQLDVASDSLMILVFIALETKQSNVGTLPQLVEDIRRLVAEKSPGDLEVFSSKLVKSGYLHIHEDLYSKTGYNVIHSRLYHVREGFPRLLVNELPAGVGDVRYSVAVASCLEYTTELEELKKMLQNTGDENA